MTPRRVPSRTPIIGSYQLLPADGQPADAHSPGGEDGVRDRGRDGRVALPGSGRGSVALDDSDVDLRCVPHAGDAVVVEVTLCDPPVLKRDPLKNRGGQAQLPRTQVRTLKCKHCLGKYEKVS